MNEQPNSIATRTQVARQILTMICTGRFKGGEQLSEETLSGILGSERAPAHDALNELAGIGIVDLLVDGGATVRPFGPVQIREIYQVRRLLESEATRLCINRIDKDALRQIREKTQDFLNASGRGTAWQGNTIALDQDLHELIRLNCGNQRLAEEIGRYRSIVQSIREAVGNTSNAQDLALIEHTLIIDLLLDGEGDRAAEAMSQHIDRGSSVASGALGPQPEE